jgi:SAM-dependent methyltransferase
MSASIPPTDELSQFITALRSSLEQGEFVRLTLSGYRGEETGLNSLLVQLVNLKAGVKLGFTYRYQTKEIVKNWPIADGIVQIEYAVGATFINARLFTIQQDLQINYNKRMQPRLVTTKPTFPTTNQIQEHDRQKQRYIDTKNNIYLKALGITNTQGEIIKTREAKYKQINKFIEIIEHLYRASNLPQRDRINILDLGSGKGYLTFAVYDFFNNCLNKSTNVTGIDARSELVDFCNTTATHAEFGHLQFESGTIDSLAYRPMDIAIALHACDTATDDVIYTSIQAQAEIIILAPCCHNQIRQQMNHSAEVKAIWEYGILLERQAQLVTDRLRSLFLQLHGYQTKVFEFIDAEHTDKNIMIAATKRKTVVNARSTILTQISQLKQQHGIQTYYLENLFSAHAQLSPTQLSSTQLSPTLTERVSPND